MKNSLKLSPKPQHFSLSLQRLIQKTQNDGIILPCTTDSIRRSRHRRNCRRPPLDDDQQRPTRSRQPPAQPQNRHPHLRPLQQTRIAQPRKAYKSDRRFVKNVLNVGFLFLFSVNFIPLLMQTGDSRKETSRSDKRRHICFIRFRSQTSGKQ